MGNKKKSHKKSSSYGTIDRLPSGRYRVRVRGADGKQRSVGATFARKADAEDALADLRAQRVKLSPSGSVAAFIETWLESASLAPRTRDLYGSHVANHILPTLGTVQLRDLTADVIRVWYAGLDTGPAAKARAYRVLRAALNVAVADRLIPSNPCTVRGAGQTPPKQHATRILTIEQIEALAAAIEPRFRLVPLLAGYGGLRWAEILGLRSEDVGPSWVRVVRQRTQGRKSGFDVTQPKSRAGARTVHLPPHVMAIIAATTPTDGYLVPAITRTNFRRPWRRALAACAIDGAWVHDLRHTAVTLWIAAGATPVTVQRMIGHASIALTFGTYGHLFPNAGETIADALAAQYEALSATVAPAGLAVSAGPAGVS